MNEQSGKIIQLVSFKLDKEEFGVDILKVQEINKMIEITQMPNSPKFVEGIVNLRGRLIPIVDLRKRLNIEPVEYDNSTRIIIVDVNGIVVGFIVDEVNEVLRINESIMEAPPSMVSNINDEFITSVAKLDNRLLIMLDLEKVLSAQEKEELEVIEQEV